MVGSLSFISYGLVCRSLEFDEEKVQICFDDFVHVPFVLNFYDLIVFSEIGFCFHL